MKYHVKYYYLATGMEGIADTKDFGIVEADSEEEALEVVVNTMDTVRQSYPLETERSYRYWGLSATKVPETFTEELEAVENMPNTSDFHKAYYLVCDTPYDAMWIETEGTLEDTQAKVRSMYDNAPEQAKVLTQDQFDEVILLQNATIMLADDYACTIRRVRDVHDEAFALKTYLENKEPAVW